MLERGLRRGGEVAVAGTDAQYQIRLRKRDSWRPEEVAISAPRVAVRYRCWEGDEQVEPVVAAGRFIDGSRAFCDGWVSFYWGKTVEENEKAGGLQGALVAEWLR